MREQQIAEVDVSLRLLAPELEVRGLPAKVTRLRTAVLPHGVLRLSVLRALQQAQQPLTVRQIHDAVVAAQGVVFTDPEARRKHRQLVRESLHALANASPPRVEALDAMPPNGTGMAEQRWQLGSLLREPEK